MQCLSFCILSIYQNINTIKGQSTLISCKGIFLVQRKNARMQFLCVNPLKGKDHYLCMKDVKIIPKSTIIDVAAKQPHHHCWVKMVTTQLRKGNEFLYKTHMQTFIEKRLSKSIKGKLKSNIYETINFQKRNCINDTQYWATEKSSRCSLSPRSQHCNCIRNNFA